MPDKDIMVQIRQREEQRPWAALDALTDDPRTVPGLINALTVLAEDWRKTADLYADAKGKGFQTTYVVPLRHAAAELDKVIKGLEQPRRALLGQLQQPDYAAVNAGLDEPAHRFEVGPGATGRTCTAMVERDGAGDQCGRFASHPAHRLQTPAIGDGAGLDALIADQVAKHRDEINNVLIAPLTEAMRDEVAAVHASNPIAQIASAPDFPGQASGEEVAAYLRGEADDIPGTPPLTPSSVRDQTAPEPPEHDLGVFGIDERVTGANRTWNPDYPGCAPETCGGSRLDPCSTVLKTNGERHDGDQLLSDPARNSARQILETMPVSAIIPPIPLLGQPGNAGAGYDHTYVPSGGVPASFAELLTPVPPAALPVHISHSQIETSGECPAKYRLTRLNFRPDGSAVEEIPQWAFIGGSAFHAAIEDMERIWAANPNDPFDVVTADEESGRIWADAFGAEIAKIEASSPVPRGRWRASKQGAEGESWWNANGPLMIERYLKARPAEPTANLPGVSGAIGDFEAAIELERIVEVDTQTPYGVIPYKAIIDRVTTRTDPGSNWVTLVVRDYKASATMPSDEGQLGEYANVLRLLGVPPHVKIVGTFFNARKGTWTPEADLDAQYPADWFRYLVATGHANRLALTQGPTAARPSSYCGGCPVRWACPAKAAGR